MLSVSCYTCGQELNKPGALVFAPPDPSDIHGEPVCEKFHICTRCWSEVFEFINMAHNG